MDSVNNKVILSSTVSVQDLIYSHGIKSGLYRIEPDGKRSIWSRLVYVFFLSFFLYVPRFFGLGGFGRLIRFVCCLHIFPGVPCR